MENTNPLIQTKFFRTRVDKNLVPRPRLLEQLNRGLERPLPLVAAPAGYGKTTQVATWLEECNWPSAWLSLDKDDSDLNLFLSYFLAAIRTIFPEECAEKTALFHAPTQQPMVQSPITTKIDNPCLLVYHYIVVL